MQLSSSNGRPHLDFFSYIVYLHFRFLVLGKPKLKITVSLPDLFDNQSFQFRYFCIRNSRRDGENNGFLAGVYFPTSSCAPAPRVSLVPKTPVPFPFKRLPRRLLLMMLTKFGN